MMNRVLDVELEAQDVVELPGREVMSLVNLNAALPINAAIALNALSDGSTAAAGAQQIAPIGQGMMGTTSTPALPAGL